MRIGTVSLGASRVASYTSINVSSRNAARKVGVVGAFVAQRRQPGGGQRVVDDAHIHGL